MNRSRKVTPLSVLPLATIGAAVGMLILSTGIDDTARGHRLAQTPEFYVWLILVGAQTAITAAVLPLVWSHLQRLQPNFELAKSRISLATAMFAVLFWLPAAIPRTVYLAAGDWPLPHQSVKLRLIGFVCFVPVLLAVVSVLLLTARFAASKPHRDSPEVAMESCLSARDGLRELLFVLGAQVSAATLSLGAMRRAMIAADGNGFSAILVLMYGAYFSGLLLLLYLPAHRLWRAEGEEIVSLVAPLPSPTDASWLAADQKRRAMTSYLEIDATAHALFNRAVMLLGPLIAGLVSFLLG